MIKTIVVLIVINLCVIQYDTIQVQAIDDKPNLVLLGDSITALSKHSWLPEGLGSYSDLLTEWWNDSVEVFNSGIGATQLRNVDVDKRISKYHPKYVIIMYGLNDIGIYGDVNIFTYHYNRVLREIKEQNPNATVFISTEIWANESYYGLCGNYPEHLQEIFRNATIQVANAWNLTLVDLYPKFYRNSSYADEWEAHPNEAGALVIAETLNESFYNLLENTPFNYIEEIQIEKKYNINLTMYLTVNIQENESNDVNYTIPLLMFLISYILALCVFLFEEKKKLSQIVHPI